MIIVYMFNLFALLGAIAVIIRSRQIMSLDDQVARESRNTVANGSAWSLATCYTNFINLYAIPVAEFIISLLYGLYIRFTFLNVVVFILKYVPPSIYVYTFIKNHYVASRERLKQKQMELEDIQLQIQIINNKLCVRESEFSERQEHLRRAAERLRRLRARVKEVIAGDENLRHALENFKLTNTDNELQTHCTPKEEREYILESLKEMKCDQVAIPARLSERMECGEAPSKSNADDDSVYSLLNDADGRQDCRLKIIKVTNVYKVAYLKHYIKQKRLRRANKQMLLKKKMESVKKLLEDWQKALNMVINNKLTILNMDGYLDGASQEAMGDYTKPHESSDSDSDLRNSSSDAYYDEYNLSWGQNQYTPYAYNCDDLPETVVPRDVDYQEYNDMKYPSQHDDGYHRTANMVSIIEETNSQMAIEEIKQNFDNDGRPEYGK